MARAVTTIITCDMCAGNDNAKDAATTYAFTYNNTNYEIDLCPEHGGRFEGELSTWIGLARRVDARKRRSTGNATRNLKEVRVWAKGHGYTLGDRGRIPREVMDAFDVASKATT